MADVDGQPRGTAYGIRDDEPGLAGIGGMWVASAFRGRGLGKALLDAVLEWARSEGFSAVRVWVPAHGNRARSLYAGAGFAPTGASREVHGEIPFVANEMRLDLGVRTRPPDRGRPR